MKTHSLFPALRRYKHFDRSVWVNTKTLRPKLAPSTKTLHVAPRHYLFGISGQLAVRPIFLLLSIAATLLGGATAVQSAPVGFVDTASLATARYFHTATLLPNGKVLVAGGDGNGPSQESAELYDPASGTWTATGSLSPGTSEHTATLLPNGKVLVAGGFNGDFEFGFNLANAELYDPASGTWAATGSLGTARSEHTATLLPNGRVLVAGGFSDNYSFLASAELYDPASGTWTATRSLGAARSSHTATLLPNGKVLVAAGFNGNLDNGFNLATAELYDPASESWRATGSLAVARTGHTATLLPNGKVLVAGGFNHSTWLASAELYDPASGTWTATGSLGAARSNHTATLLPNGKVLVAGGFQGDLDNGVELANAELYDPASGTWTATGSLGAARSAQTATLLPNGKVLVAGGFGNSGALASAELYGTPVSRLVNFSTRGFVQPGDNVLIGGFIVTGAGPKQVILRALGPTLGQFNIPNALANPVLELYDARSMLITSNADWGSAPNAAAISASGFAPPNSLESAILTTLSPGNYTAIVRGANNSSGVALVEGYDLDNTAVSTFANVSTRGLVQSGANVMIAGVIVQGPDSESVIIRGLGPTLGQPPFNVPNALQDPFLDLRDTNGNPMMTNDNWGSASNAAAISNSGYAPPNSHEAAILITLAPGNYTAILSGVNGTSGVGLVEVYAQ
jgi:N-acetylneuraminic acid mutarotase